MSKQNHSNPPELTHNGRLNNSVLRSRKYKRPNAFKHGVYATPALIPGEDQDEYEELLAPLLDQYKPSGPSLRHAVYCLADLMWRLRRLTKSVQTELYENTFDPHHPAFDEVWGFSIFIHYLGSDPEACFEKHAKKHLRRDKIDDLKQKFPRENYQSTAEWAKAVRTEILSFSQPAKPRFEVPELGYRAGELEQAVRQWQTEQKVKGSIVYSRELLDYELKGRERLLALIAKQTRYCAELKAWEEAEEMRSKSKR